MVNENNKYVPKVPETFQVAYLETNQEVKNSPLSTAAQSKVIRKWGGGYVSERAGEVNPGYGPMTNHNDFYCSYGSCQNKVGSRGEYCSIHKNTCSECGTRIPSGYDYCPSHVNSCLNCGERIPSGMDNCRSCERELERLRREAYHEIMSAMERQEERRASEEQSCRIS